MKKYRKKAKLNKDEYKLMLDTKKWWLDYAQSPVFDRKLAEDAIYRFYNFINQPKPKIVFCDSPIGTIILPVILQNSSLRSSLGDSLQSSLQSSLLDSLGVSLRICLKSFVGDSLQNSLQSSLQNSLGDSLLRSLQSSLWNSLQDSLQSSLQDSLLRSLQDSLQSSLGDSLWSSLWNSLRSSLWDSLQDSLQSSLGDSLLRSLQNHWHYGLHSAYWIVFYDFCKKIGVSYCTRDSQILQTHLDYAKSAFWCNAYENICFISAFPIETHLINFNNQIVYHNESAPAIIFRDGYKLYALNGVIVDEKIVITSSERLDPEIIFSTKNVEVRREILRKIGIERMLNQLKAITKDTWNEYTLLEFNIGFGPIKMLKMKNPSLGIWHLEGVPPECKTVSEALQSRKPDWMRNIPINDDHGLDWYQQGDVLIVPECAKSLKRYPHLLT